MLLMSAWDEDRIIKSLPRKYQTVPNCSMLFVNTVSFFVFGRAAIKKAKKKKKRKESCASLKGISPEVGVTV